MTLDFGSNQVEKQAGYTILCHSMAKKKINLTNFFPAFRISFCPQCINGNDRGRLTSLDSIIIGTLIWNRVPNKMEIVGIPRMDKRRSRFPGMI